jgi:hypothetical protein
MVMASFVGMSLPEGGRVDEEDFWIRLEYRICAEFRGFADRELRDNWCDGMDVEEYDLRPPRRTIRGRAWCGPDGQESWRFTLLVGQDVWSREEVDWSVLLPADRLTGWLSPDPQQRSMVIDPLGGYPD